MRLEKPSFPLRSGGFLFVPAISTESLRGDAQDYFTNRRAIVKSHGRRRGSSTLMPSRTTLTLRALIGCLLLASLRLAHAASVIQPALYVYDCVHNDFGECRTAIAITPPFATCAGWAGCVLPNAPPEGAPYTFSEGPFNGQFGERGKQCGIVTSGGSLYRRSIALPFCQTVEYSLAGS